MSTFANYDRFDISVNSIVRISKLLLSLQKPIPLPEKNFFVFLSDENSQKKAIYKVNVNKAENSLEVASIDEYAIPMLTLNINSNTNIGNLQSNEIYSFIPLSGELAHAFYISTFCVIKSLLLFFSVNKELMFLPSASNDESNSYLLHNVTDKMITNLEHLL